MNISEARKTHLIDYLNQNGHKPFKIQYGNAWFISPMRQEKTPSFKVHLSKNVFFDFLQTNARAINQNTGFRRPDSGAITATTAPKHTYF